MSMKITGDKKFMGELRKRRVRAREAARLGVCAGAKIIQLAAHEKAPVRAGALNKIVVQPDYEAMVEGDEIYTSVGSPEPYAAAHEFGSDPYMINSPVKMDFGWRYIGMHPGITATPFLRPAMDENKDEYNREVAETIKEVWK